MAHGSAFLVVSDGLRPERQACLPMAAPWPSPPAPARLSLWAVPSPVAVIIDQLMLVMRQGDLAGFQRLFERLATEGPRLSADQLTAAIGELAPVLAHRPEGVFARLALAAGAYVEWGGSPLALAASAPTCALLAMRLRARFSELWPVAGGGRSEPSPEQAPAMDELIGLFRAAAGGLGLSGLEAEAIALSWFDVGHWVNLMITVLGQREFRAVAGLLPEIGEAAAQLGDAVPRAHWLIGLAQVLDDEPLIVIDHTSGRGFRLTMSGIGDNFQLHTLLADRLIGDPARGFLSGERPTLSGVAAATTGPPRRPSGDPIQRRFRLFDGTGAYIYPEGRPADIPLVHGVRVIVLHPPRGSYRWACGRTYEHMASTLTLDEIMPPDEVHIWRTQIASSRETDLFGTVHRR
jgi:hypothetical protein